MCRHLAYLGPPVTLAGCVLHQPHSLMHQSWAPSDMRGGGTVNADGFGIGWIVGGPGDGGLARRYRRDRPMWSDASLPDLAASVTSGVIMAAVRSATIGMPVTESACAPFVEGAAMFSHNGVVDGWPDSVAPLAHALPPTVLMTLDAPTDSAFLRAPSRSAPRHWTPTTSDGSRCPTFACSRRRLPTARSTPCLIQHGSMHPGLIHCYSIHPRPRMVNDRTGSRRLHNPRPYRTLATPGHSPGTDQLPQMAPAEVVL